MVGAIRVRGGDFGACRASPAAGMPHRGKIASARFNHPFAQRSKHVRGELKLTRATPVGPDLLLTSVHVGAIGLERTGDTTVNAVLLGANLPFVTPGKNDVAGVLGGGGIEWRTREGVSMFGAAEAIGFSDQSTVWSARGGIRVAL
jgi:hypothetical protein